jgi:hypothetical protein
MAKPRISGGLPAYAFILIDLVSFVLSVGPGAVAFAAAAMILRHFWGTHWFFFVALFAVIPLVLVFLGVLFCLRLAVPRLKRGVYPLGINLGLFSWYCHLALSRSGEVCGLRPLLHSFYLTKFLYWRALGMKIPFGVNTSIGVSFVDLPMITIGRGCTISEGIAADVKLENFAWEHGNPANRARG